MYDSEWILNGKKKKCIGGGAACKRKGGGGANTFVDKIKGSKKVSYCMNCGKETISDSYTGDCLECGSAKQ